MKAATIIGLALVLMPGRAHTHAAPSADLEAKAFTQGLRVTEYPRHASQNHNDQEFFLPLAQLGKPIGDVAIAESLYPWKWNGERNAVAAGFLEVPEDGEYAFTTRSFYDRNYLLTNDELVCKFRDGDDHIATIPLKKGRVKITSVGMVESRGTDEGVRIRWKPPGQLELSEIPPAFLWHVSDGKIAQRKTASSYLITTADDFIVDAYHNGIKIADSRRKILEERFGATVERIDILIRPGDWLVFQVANNRLRWGGVRYFAVAGLQKPNQFRFVSNPSSRQWSACDDLRRVSAFITDREAGTEKRAKPIKKPWQDGDRLMRQFAGSGFDGQAVWGEAAMTWIKYVAPHEDRSADMAETVPVSDSSSKAKPAPTPLPTPPAQPPLTLKRWPVQILSAVYGTGGKDADVTSAVKEFVEVKMKLFSVNPPDLGIDPNPYWNKSLHIVYMKDGVRREQRRNENEWVLPESFYGPQDAHELRAWLIGSRWTDAKGEIQFHADRTLTGSAIKSAPIWETLGPNLIRITWSSSHAVEYTFDYTWSSFSVPSNAKEVFHGVK